MPHSYYIPLIQKFEIQGDPERAAGMKKYMKGHFDYYGIPTPLRQEITRDFLKKFGMPEMNILEDVCWSLWEEPMRECQYTVLFLLNRLKKKLSIENLPLIESLITSKSWWDTVDGLAAWMVGAIFQKHPEAIIPKTSEWMASDNIWLQRTCLIFQLTYKKNTDTALLFNFIETLSDHKLFWIRKAIGWALREYSKTDPDVVLAFVNSHQLAPLSRREALKIIEKNKTRD
jgi:3-methyladenine DNA glycosylase AlkD